jgi:hypothetical protein
MNSKIILGAVLVSSAALFGCSKEVTPSTNIKTAGIAALIDVTAESESLSTVVVELRVGGSSSNTYVDLASGDRLMAKAAEDSKEMTTENEAGVYEAEFPIAAADTPFAVALERADGDNASANTGTMPAPFQIGATPATKPSRATDDITLTWTPVDTSSQMVAELTGTCIFSETVDVVGDEGTLVITKGQLQSTGGDMPKECEITLTMRRTRKGAADPAFDAESSFELHQVRKASFVSAP